MVASLPVTPSVASITSSATSAASRCRRAMTTLSFSASSFVLPLRRMPAVSTKRSALPSNSTTSSTASRVVPAIGETMARVVPVSAFSSVDLAHIGPADDGYRSFELLELAMGAIQLLASLFHRRTSLPCGCLSSHRFSCRRCVDRLISRRRRLPRIPASAIASSNSPMPRPCSELTGYIAMPNWRNSGLPPRGVAFTLFTARKTGLPPR